MNFDLKKLRERKGLSQAELAAVMNRIWKGMHPNEDNHFSADMIVRMERDTSRISIDTVLILAQVFGVTLDQLLRPEFIRLPPLEPDDNWERVSLLRTQLEGLINSFDAASVSQVHLQVLSELRTEIHRLCRKPKLACVGRPDSGKSRILNNLLGRDILPADWTPTTGAMILLKHMDDKPDFWGMETVKVFRERQDTDDADFNIERFDDNDYCENWCLVSGSYDVIESFGAHGNEDNCAEVGAIIAFVDSKVLKNCDLIDLPGFNPQPAVAEDIYDSKDSMLSAKAPGIADGFLYLSIANSFLYGEDLAMVQLLVKSMPLMDIENVPQNNPFRNLFIIASHAGAVDHGDSTVLERICESAAKRLWSMLDEHPSIPDYATCEMLQQRFFTSETDSVELTGRLYEDLKDFVELLPLLQEQKVRNQLNLFFQSKAHQFHETAQHIHSVIENRLEIQSQLEAMEDGEETFYANVQEYSSKVKNHISKMHAESVTQCRRMYEQVIEAKHIIAVVDAYGFKKNQKDLQQLVNRLNAELENKLAKDLSERSNRLKPEIDGFLKECQNAYPRVKSKKIYTDASAITIFDVGRAFAGGLTGLATFGALSAWAATCGNLGGYVLVAKAVSLLSSLGIHVGGTAAAVSAVSAIGGPVVLGITIAVSATLASILVLGGTWKKMIGSKLVKQYQEKQVLDSLIATVNHFWKDTEDAFNTGTAEIMKAFRAQLRDCRRKLAENNSDVLKQECLSAEKTAAFLVSLTSILHPTNKE